MSQGKTYLDSQLVAERADEFPAIRAILGARVEDVIAGKNKRADGAPEFLQLLERTGPGSRAALELFSEGIEYFDGIQPPGWTRWRGTLGGADRRTFGARRSELLVALWFAGSGFDILGFEPSGAPGRRADLLVGRGGRSCSSKRLRRAPAKMIGSTRRWRTSLSHCSGSTRAS